MLDPDVWPKDQIELSTYGDAEIELLANYYEDHLWRAGCELHQIVRKWSSVKSYVSLHLSSRCTEEIFATTFRSRVGECCNFLLLAEIVLIWLMSTAVVERGFNKHEQFKDTAAGRVCIQKTCWMVCLEFQLSTTRSWKPKDPRHLLTLDSSPKLSPGSVAQASDLKESSG